jgi:hypothetical protein
MMRRTITLTLALVLAAAVVAAAAARAGDNELTQQEKDEGWKLLFDGRTLAGWTPTGEAAGWAVEDGAIACTVKRGGYLHTTEQFGDFVLAIDFKGDKGTNSGIFIRWGNLRDPVHTGIEVAIDDSAGKAKPGRHDCGALYDLVAPSKNTCKPAGEWNHAVITCRGPLITVELNGEKVASMDVDQYTVAGQNPDGTRNKFRYALKEFPRRGHLGLQDHGGRVWFRNIKIRPL